MAPFNIIVIELNMFAVMVVCIIKMWRYKTNFQRLCCPIALTSEDIMQLLCQASL